MFSELFPEPYRTVLEIFVDPDWKVLGPSFSVRAGVYNLQCGHHGQHANLYFVLESDG
jgi:hypothetical protein